MWEVQTVCVSHRTPGFPHFLTAHLTNSTFFTLFLHYNPLWEKAQTCLQVYLVPLWPHLQAGLCMGVQTTPRVSAPDCDI